MGQCWHEWEWKPSSDWHDYNDYTCSICQKRTENVANPDHLSNPLPVLKWMEEHMPEVWEDYLEWVFHTLNYDSERAYTADIKSILDLSNLASYLKEHEEWAYIECEDSMAAYPDCVRANCNCNGTGKIIHAALRYAKEEGC